MSALAKSTLQRLRTVEQLADETEGRISRRSIQDWIYTNQDDFCRCVVRIGRRIYLDIDEVEAWLLERRQVPRPRIRQRADEAAPVPRFRR